MEQEARDAIFAIVRSGILNTIKDPNRSEEHKEFARDAAVIASAMSMVSSEKAFSMLFGLNTVLVCHPEFIDKFILLLTAGI